MISLEKIYAKRLKRPLMTTDKLFQSLEARHVVLIDSKRLWSFFSIFNPIYYFLRIHLSKKFSNGILLNFPKNTFQELEVIKARVRAPSIGASLYKQTRKKSDS